MNDIQKKEPAQLSAIKQHFIVTLVHIHQLDKHILESVVHCTEVPSLNYLRYMHVYVRCHQTNTQRQFSVSAQRLQYSNAIKWHFK